MVYLQKYSICLRWRRPRFNPWVGKSPWRREWQLITVFLTGESHGQGSPTGYRPWGCKESDTTEQLTLSILTIATVFSWKKKRYLLNIYTVIYTKDNVQITFIVPKHFLFALDCFFWTQLHSSSPSTLATQFLPPHFSKLSHCPLISPQTILFLRKLLRLH